MEIGRSTPKIFGLISKLKIPSCAIWLALVSMQPLVWFALRRITAHVIEHMWHELLTSLVVQKFGTCCLTLKEQSLISGFGLRLRWCEYADTQPLIWKSVNCAHHQHNIFGWKLLLIFLAERSFPA